MYDYVLNFHKDGSLGWGDNYLIRNWYNRTVWCGRPLFLSGTSYDPTVGALAFFMINLNDYNKNFFITNIRVTFNIIERRII